MSVQEVVIVIDGARLDGIVDSVGPVVTFVETKTGRALVTTAELEWWNPGILCTFLGHALHTVGGKLASECLRCEAELSAEDIAIEFERMEVES
jgi:hypothetical protein